jgi:hypothetical protein
MNSGFTGHGIGSGGQCRRIAIGLWTCPYLITVLALPRSTSLEEHTILTDSLQIQRSAV